MKNILFEGGKALEGTRSISKNEIESTLKYLSPIIGIPFESTRNKKGNIIKWGLVDSTLGSADKTNKGEFGKKEIVGDIDIAVDESKYNFDELLSRLVQKLGAENIGKPMKGLGIISTKVPIGGDKEKGFVQVDFMLGKPSLLKFTYSAPDPESESKYSGIYRNLLMSSILQTMRRQIRDPETQEIIALVGPSLILNQGVVNQWRHFPLRKNKNGRLTTMKAISREEFDKLYPNYKGKEKELTLQGPQDILNFIFPNAKLKPSDIDSYEKLRNAVIKYKPNQANAIFDRFITNLERQKLEIPSGLVTETLLKLETYKLLNEVRQISLEIIKEAIAKPGKFEEFCKKTIEILKKIKKGDHFAIPKINADTIPDEGIKFLLKNTGLMPEYNKIINKDYKNDDYHRINDFFELFIDLCKLMLEKDFFFVTNHYKINVTPESFVISLLNLTL